MIIEDAALCFRHEPVLNFFHVMDYLRFRGWGDLHDEMFAMWPTWEEDKHHNDSYWHLYRDWIPTETGKLVWDIICEELGIADPSDKIVFWVSW